MLRFYGKLIRHVHELLWDSAGRLDKAISICFLVLSVFGVTPWWPFSLLWALVPLVVLFVYGLMKANFEAFQKVEQERVELTKTLEERKKRAALGDLLTAAYRKGTSLRGRPYEEVDKWIEATSGLIEAALGSHRVVIFRSNSGISVQQLWGIDVSPESPMQAFAIGVRWVDARLERLKELMIDLDHLTIRPDFDPQDWNNR